MSPSRPDGHPGSHPWLPPAQVVMVPGRGEMFVRVHRHRDPDAPWLLLLHGWTASADLQFFTAYPELAARYSFVAVDHRGHGRGLRSLAPFTLEDAADDAAEVLAVLGVGPVVAVGYSMGGPIAMLLARRHPESVRGLVVQATAQEWHRTRRERWVWYGLPVLGLALRSWWFPRSVRRAVTRVVPAGHVVEPHLPWLLAELQRVSPQAVVDAGRALRRYDAVDWAPRLGVPAAALVLTRDRLVRPRKQRALAAALGATVRELPVDHLATLSHPEDYARATVELVEAVTSTSVSL